MQKYVFPGVHEYIVEQKYIQHVYFIYTRQRTALHKYSHLNDTASHS